MVFILTAQLYDDEPVGTAFARYQAYLESVRGRLPAGAFELATSAWYFNSEDHRAPHDARLEDVTVCETPSPDGSNSGTVEIKLRLRGAYDDGRIEFRYPGVTRYQIKLNAAAPDERRGHQDWRYDEFRLSGTDRVEHEIEWWGARPNGTWLIEAADVHYTWTPLDADDVSAADLRP